MATIIAPNPTQGAALLSGSQSWLSKASDGDSFDASNNLVTDPLRLSATETQSFIDFFTAISGKVNLNRTMLSFIINANSANGWVFVCDKIYTLKSIKEVHSTIPSSGSAVTLAIRKITDASAPNAAAGTTVKEQLSSTLNLKSTVNIVVTGSLSSTGSDLVFAAGNKIAFNFTGDLTAFAGGCVTIELGF